ncbi:hypothetical protein [Mycolicibacterium phlei]|uniref:hypothetical protein n=1 Tax=Mycolicibacterium phlei TaxID=1771 RepID=UPI00025AEEB1|nr:hypothetical protein [Mycolicibacterium phlei]EID13280.1 hypothetical protein MPHLEI_14809 [Mycolicibacterium phlei RIVM601174]MBF4193327.1 hypothetical protein [Mycolicibacterium phlei]
MSAVPSRSGALSRSEIEEWPTQHLDDAATQLRSMGAQSVALFDEHRRNVDSPGGTTWEGNAKDAALDRVTADTAVVRQQTTVQNEAADIAENGGHDVRAAKQEAVGAITAAENDGFTVAEDLTVTDSRRYDINTIVERNKAAKEHAEDIRWYAERLIQADSFVGERLQAKAAELEAIRFDGEDDQQGGNGAHIALVDHTFKLDPPPSEPGLPQPPGGWSDDPVMEDAQRIAYGHAWQKHFSDFKGMTQDQLAKLVHDMLTGNPQTDPSLHVGQIPGRSSTAMYKDGIVVIHDPLTGDGGHGLPADRRVRRVPAANRRCRGCCAHHRRTSEPAAVAAAPSGGPPAAARPTRARAAAVAAARRSERAASVAGEPVASGDPGVARGAVDPPEHPVDARPGCGSKPGADQCARGDSGRSGACRDTGVPAVGAGLSVIRREGDADAGTWIRGDAR